MNKHPNGDDIMDTTQPGEEKALSRRDFLKGAAIGGLGIAVATVLPGCDTGAEPAPAESSEESAASQEPAVESAPEESAVETPAETPAQDTADAGDWLGVEPDIPESDITSTVDVDVVVVGAGLAGVCAARAAAEEGATVAIVEKAAQANCRSGEFAVIGGSLNEYFERPALDPNMIVDRFMQECSYRIKRPIISRWANEAHEAIDWYIEARPDLYIAKTTREEIPDENKDAFLVPLAWPQPDNYNYAQEDFPTYPSSIEFRPSQAPVFNANVERCVSELGVQAFYGHKAEKLEKDGDRITGIVVRDMESGGYIRLNAARGVVMATGDNANNPAIVSHFCPQLDVLGISGMNIGADVEGNPINTGDGLIMGVRAGAKAQNSHAPMTHHMGAGMGITPFLLLNKQGRRFMNESVPGQQLENQLELQTDYTAYQIFDDGWREQLAYMPANHGGCCYYDNELPTNNESDRQYLSDAAFQERVDSGQILVADTLEELLDQLEIDKEAALASIQRYNELAEAGNDADFNKPAQRLFAVENGPFYACTMGLTIMLVCIGGLESDEECRVYDETLRPIPGLYAAGNVQGDRYAVEYPICMRGISHSMAVFYGYVAGKSAAAQL